MSIAFQHLQSLGHSDATIMLCRKVGKIRLHGSDQHRHAGVTFEHIHLQYRQAGTTQANAP